MASIVLSFLFSSLLGQETSDALVQRAVLDLSSEDVAKRDRAVEELKAAGPGASAALSEALKSSDPELRFRAKGLLRWIDINNRIGASLKAAIPKVVDRLAQGEDREWVSVLIQAMDLASDRRPNSASPDIDISPLVGPAAKVARTDTERLRVCRAAASTRCHEAETSLLEYLRDPSGEVRAKAIAAVAALGSKAGISEGLRLLEDRHAGVRAAAIEGLATLGCRQAVPRIASLLNDDDAYVRFTSIKALETLAAVEWLPQIIRKFEDPSELVRTMLTFDPVLERMGGTKLVPAIIPLLRSDDALTRRSAVQALQVLDAAQARTSLVALLEDPDHGVRALTAGALGNLGTLEDAQALSRALTDENSTVRARAAGALGSLRASGFRSQVEQLLSDRAEDVRYWSSVALGLFGDRASVPTLLAGCKDGVPKVRRACLESLGAIRAAGSAAQIRPMLDDPSESVRAEAALTLGKLRDKNSVSALLGALADQSPGVGKAAAEALCYLGDRRGAVALLKYASQDESVSVNPLNATKDSNLWSRLDGIPCPATATGPRSEALEWITKTAEIPAVYDPGLSQWAASTPHTPAMFRCKAPGTVLKALLGLRTNETDFVFDDGRVRFLPRKEALAFWAIWLARNK